MIFELAKPYDYFAGAERVDDMILDAARAITSRLEVGRRTAAEWEAAILAGFAVWRALRDSEGARLASTWTQARLRSRIRPRVASDQEVAMAPECLQAPTVEGTPRLAVRGSAGTSA
jgi:hypothetical protein